MLAAALLAALLAPAPATVAQPAGPSPADPDRAAQPAAHLPPPPGTTSLVSRGRNDRPANGASAEPAISGNGRFVAFTSAAGNLVAGDSNGALDVFVLDRRTGRITRAPLFGGATVPQGGRASEPSISSSGRIVAFTYQAPPVSPSSPTAFVPPPPGPIVLAWDRQTGRVELVSKTRQGALAQGSRQPAVSANGRYVAFTSSSDSIDPEDEDDDDVFRYDRQTGRAVLLSVNPDGRPIRGSGADSPSISGDGNLVAFASNGSKSVTGQDVGPGVQLYVRDMRASRTEWITSAPDGGPANGEARGPAISADGRYVAFQSAATNLVSGPGAGSGGLFRRDLRTGATIMVSLAADGSSPGDGTSSEASITADGHIVAFTSMASNLVSLTAARIAPAALTRGRSEVYVRDVDAGETVLVSVSRDAGLGGALSAQTSVDDSGRFIAFASTSENLVAGDRNDAADVFLRDLPPVPVINPPVLDLGARAVGTDSLPGAAVLANAGWTPLSVTGASITGSARADFRIVANGCRNRVLRRGEACTVSVIFRPSRTGTRNATLQVQDTFTGSPRTVRLVGTASRARIEVDPEVGPPGVVVVATGTGFPPGTQVRLSWSRGITPRLGPVVADERGRFRVQVLVFHHDLVGRRELIGEPVRAGEFPPVSVPVLISQPSVVPPTFGILRRFIDLPIVLVIRG